MSIFNWFSNKEVEKRVSLEVPENWSAHGGGCSSEVIVNEQSALTYGAVYCAIRCIAETIATLPFPTYRYLDGGGKEKDHKHPVYRLLDKYPNQQLSSVQFREALIAHVLTYGNGFAEIIWGNDGRPAELHLCDPKKVKVVKRSNHLINYKLNGDNDIEVPSSKIIHIAGLGYDGLIGYSPIQMGMKAISLGMKAEAYGDSFFGNACRPGGVVTHPGKLTPNAKDNITGSLNHNHSGTTNVGKWMLLCEGATFHPLEISNQEAQFLETRKMSITDIARLFRLPPHKISDLSASTNNNIEQQSIDFVQDSIRPWCVRIEKEFNRKLFTESEQETWFCEHSIDGLLRADSSTRWTVYNIALQNGVLNRDEVRELENRNPLPNGEGKKYLAPLNMAPVGSPSEQPAAARAIEQQGKLDNLFVEQRALPAPINSELATAALEALTQSLNRMLTKETNAAKRAARSPETFSVWLEMFYSSHVETVRSAIAPSLKAHLLSEGGLFDDNSPQIVAERWAKANHAELLEASTTCEPHELTDSIGGLVGNWLAVRVEDVLPNILNN